MNTMLKLVNIKKTDSYIEANFIPENDVNSLGYVKINLDTGEETSQKPDGYIGYTRMAFTGLKEILSDMKKDREYKLPKERLVMWY